MPGPRSAQLSNGLRRVQLGAVVVLACVFPLGKSAGEVALAIGLLAWAGRLLLDRRGFSVFRNPLTPWLLAWLVLAACSMANSIDIASSVKGIEKLLKYFGLYFLVISTVDSPASLRTVLKGCLVGLCLVVGDGVWQWLHGADVVYGHPLDIALGEVRRITATFQHPDDFSIYLVTFCPVVLALALKFRSRWRVALWVLAGLTTLVLLLTWTRGGMLAFLIELGLLAVLVRHWIPAVLAAVMAAIEAASVPAAVKAWAATMPTPLHLLTQPERLMYWQAALNMVKAHPIIGVGVNTFVRAYPHYRIVGDRFAQTGPYAHNQYLQLAAEVGLMGLAVFLVLLARVGWAASRRVAARQADPFLAVVNAGLLAGFAGYLVVGCVESSLYYLQGAMAFWLLIGLLVALGVIWDAPRVKG